MSRESYLLGSFGREVARRREQLDAVKRYAPAVKRLAKILPSGHFLDGGVSDVVSVDGFTAEADPRLAELLEKVLDFAHWRKVTANDLPDEATRVYYFLPEFDDCETPAVAVYATLRDTSKCQRVKVGTKTVQKYQTVTEEVPVYEFVCG